jgi:hypothetical protein
MNRPQSVTVLAILQLISGVFSLLDGLFILLFAGILSGFGAAVGAAKFGAVIGGFIGIFRPPLLTLSLGFVSTKKMGLDGNVNCPHHRHPRANCQNVGQRRYSSQFFNSGFCSG